MLEFIGVGFFLFMFVIAGILNHRQYRREHPKVRA